MGVHWEFGSFLHLSATEGMATLIKTESVEARVDSENENLAIIEFTRAKQLNSFTSQQYADLSQVLKAVDANENIYCAILTGKGRFYSSGHDLRQQLSNQTEEGTDQKEFLKAMIARNAGQLIDVMIHFEKPLIAAVNGPAVGVAATTIQLCDIIYASSTATFNVPFMQLGFCAEGCSSLLFPMVMGLSKANEMLLLGKKLTAEEAKQCNFVSDVFPQDKFMDEVLERGRRMASFPPNALRQTKALTRGAMKQMLLDTSERELTLLADRFMSEECANAVIKFVMEQQAKKSAKL